MIPPGETSLSKHLKKANQQKLRFVLILGSEEIKKGKWTVKDLEQKRQEEVEDAEVVGYLEKLMIQSFL